MHSIEVILNKELGMLIISNMESYSIQCLI